VVDDPKVSFELGFSSVGAGGGTVVAEVGHGTSGERRAATDDHRAPRSLGWRPFRIAIVAELNPNPDYALRVRPPCRILEATRSSLDELFARVEPSFRIDVTDPLTGGPLEVDLAISSPSDFRPSALLTKVAPLRRLRDAVRSVCTAQEQNELARVLERLLGTSAAPLLRLVRTESRTRTATVAPVKEGRTPEVSALDALLTQIDLPDIHAASTPSLDTDALVARLTEALHELLCQILVHPEVRRLEALATGLELALQSVISNRLVEPVVVTWGATELSAVTAALDQALPDLVVLEQSFAATASDTTILRAWAEWAALHQIPVVAGLDTTWFEGEGEESATRARLARPSPSARRLLETLSSLDESRWLCLICNDPCLRMPHEVGLEKPLGQFRLPAAHLNAWSFCSGPLGVVALLHRQLVEHGQPMPCVGEHHGRLRELGVRVVEDADRQVSIATQLVATADHVEALARLGVCCWLPVVNRDQALLLECVTAHRPRTASGDLGRPDSTLVDQLLVGRAVRLLRRAVGLVTNGTFTRQEASSWLEESSAALFCDPPPVGPEVEVSCSERGLCLELHPRRHGELRLEQVRLEKSWE